MKLKLILINIAFLFIGTGLFSYAQENDEVRSKQIELSVYPNPAEDNLWLKIQERQKEAIQVEIINILGEKVKEVKLEANEPKIDVSSLKEGLYIISVKIGDKKTLKKFYKK